MNAGNDACKFYRSEAYPMLQDLLVGLRSFGVDVPHAFNTNFSYIAFQDGTKASLSVALLCLINILLYVGVQHRHD